MDSNGSRQTHDEEADGQSPQRNGQERDAQRQEKGQQVKWLALIALLYPSVSNCQQICTVVDRNSQEYAKFCIFDVHNLCLFTESERVRNVNMFGTAELTVPTEQDFRWAHDKWFGDDKVAHWGVGFAGSHLAVLAFNVRGTGDRIAVVGYQTLFWIGWEIKDGTVPWEKYGAIGGDGFSWKDLIFSLAGAAIPLVVH